MGKLSLFAASFPPLSTCSADTVPPQFAALLFLISVNLLQTANRHTVRETPCLIDLIIFPQPALYSFHPAFSQSFSPHRFVHILCCLQPLPCRFRIPGFVPLMFHIEIMCCTICCSVLSLFWRQSIWLPVKGFTGSTPKKQ